MRGRRTIIFLAVTVAIVIGSGLWWSAKHPSALPAPRGSADWSPVTEQSLSHGRFDHFTLYSPHGAPRGFILLLSGRDGWTAAMTDMARALALNGAMVAGIDVAKLDANFEADPAGCVYPDGDLENLSHFLQAYARLPVYLPPILAGQGAGAAFAYAALAQAPAKTFGGAVSMDFCAALALRKPMCKSGTLDYTVRPSDGAVQLLPAKQLSDPWVVVQGDTPDPAAAAPDHCDAASVTGFTAAVPSTHLISLPNRSPAVRAVEFGSLIDRNSPPASASPPQALSDLPLIVVPAQTGAAATDTFAIMLSGDGGWAGLDKEVASALTADGISVIGLDSLRYFWSPRTAAGLASDLDRMIGYYLKELGKQRVVLIGYSQGADVLPFAINRLSDAARSHVKLAAVLGLSEHALFEFHMASWIADDHSGPETLPEVDRIAGVPVLCIYGEEETDSLCPKLDPRKTTVVKLKGGHHFDGNYDGLARTILASVRH